MGFFDALGNILTGGGLGVIGGAVNAVAGGILEIKKIAEERETLKVKNDHELQMRDKDLVQLQAEAASKAELARVDQEVRTAAAEIDLQARSYDNDKAAYGGGWVDTWRGITRPLVTWVAMALMVWVTIRCLLIWNVTPPTAAEAKELITFTLTSASMYVGWWFGARVTAARFGK